MAKDKDSEPWQTAKQKNVSTKASRGEKNPPLRTVTEDGIVTLAPEGRDQKIQGTSAKHVSSHVPATNKSLEKMKSTLSSKAPARSSEGGKTW